ncbi:hypothetical protein Tco_0536910 [Tanacetum coccineum]
MSEIIQSSRHKVLRKEEKIYNDWNAEVSRLERLYVASEYMKAGDGAVEDTYEISLDIKRTNEMIDEYKKKLEKAHESLSHLKRQHALSHAPSLPPRATSIITSTTCIESDLSGLECFLAT